MWVEYLLRDHGRLFAWDEDMGRRSVRCCRGLRLGGGWQDAVVCTGNGESGRGAGLGVAGVVLRAQSAPSQV